MKNYLLLPVLALSLAVPATAAPTIEFEDGNGTPEADVTTFEDFEMRSDGDSLGTNAFVFDSSEDGIAARPAFGSTGNFGAVLGDPVTGLASFTFARPATRFGFTLGSLDTYNTLTLRFADGSTQTYNGGQIAAGLGNPNGSQTNGLSNGFVTFRQTAGGPRIAGADFVSSSNSFEFDNLSVGGVPEPTTWAMMIFGFAMVGGAMRRRKSATAKVSFA